MNVKVDSNKIGDLVYELLLDAGLEDYRAVNISNEIEDILIDNNLEELYGR